MAEKPVLHMREWELYAYQGEYSLFGITEEEPETWDEGQMGRTAPMVGYSFEADVLTYETEYAVYVCPLGCLTEMPYGDFFHEDVEELKELVKEPKNPLERIIYVSVLKAMEEPAEGPIYEFVMHVSELQKKERQERLVRVEQENIRLMENAGRYDAAVYIEFVNLVKDKLGFCLNDIVGVMEPKVRWGESRNSSRVVFSLYPGKNNPNRLDFRYFLDDSQDERGIRTYSWSENIEYVVVKNAGQRVLLFNSNELLPGETKVFTREIHRQEIVLPEEM